MNKKIRLDQNVENADWTKRTKALPPQEVQEAVNRLEGKRWGRFNNAGKMGGRTMQIDNNFKEVKVYGPYSKKKGC